MAKKAKRAKRGSLTKSLGHLKKRMERRDARKARTVKKLDRNTPSKPDAVARAIDVRLGSWVTPKGLAARPANTRWPVEIEIGKRHRKDFGDIAGLALSFNERGSIIQPIAINENNQLVAGERRIKAWVHPVSKFRNAPIPVHVITIDSIVAGEWDENAHRKDFTQTEAVAIKREIEKLLAAHARERQKLGRGHKAPDGKGFRASERAAAMTGRKRRTIEKAEAIVDAAAEDPERFGKLQEDMDRTGKVDGPFKRLQVMKAKAAINDAPPGLPMRGPIDGKYSVVSIDFPVPGDADKEQDKLDAQGRSFRPYPEMSIRSCCQFAREQIRPILAPDVAVWLWCTNYHLARGFMHHIIAALGFDVALADGAPDDDAKGRPVTILTWVKDQIGRGQVLRDKTEQCILITRGKPVIDVFGEDPPSTELRGPRRDNSQKPEEFYRLVERVTPAKRYAAIFSTGGEGELWDCHGDQVGKHAPKLMVVIGDELHEEVPSKIITAPMLAELQALDTIAAGGTVEQIPDHAEAFRIAQFISKKGNKLTALGKKRAAELVKLVDARPVAGDDEIITDAPGSDGAPRETGLAVAADHRAGDRQPAGLELPFGAPACRVCGCTDDKRCPGGCAMIERTLCSKCIASQDHVVNMHGGPVIEDGKPVGGERKATCSCKTFDYAGPWSDSEACERAVRSHWQDVVAEATGIPPDLRRGERQPAAVQP